MDMQFLFLFFGFFSSGYVEYSHDIVYYVLLFNKKKKSKVLIAAGVSAAIGQLSKPVTGCLLYGKDFDLKAAFQAGGFPSTHSSVCLLSLH